MGGSQFNNGQVEMLRAKRRIIFNIQDAGSQRWNIFFRQLNLNLINGIIIPLSLKLG